MSIEEKKRRLSEIERQLEGCAYEDYADLAREYSILSDQIEADENLHSTNIKKREMCRNSMRVITPDFFLNKRGVSQ